MPSTSFACSSRASLQSWSAQWTKLPHPTRILLDHTNLVGSVPLLLIGLLVASLAWIQFRVREEADQLAYALLVQAVFWWLCISYMGAVCMAAMLPFFHMRTARTAPPCPTSTPAKLRLQEGASV